VSTVAEGRTAEVGQARPRREDAHLITGRTQWTDNISLPGLLHLAILRSPVAHATITKVDVSAARERPGVVAAFSGADFADEWGSLPMAWTVSEDQKSPPHFPLTADKVRFVGDGVAVVAATSREAAVDALEAIEFEFDTLPAVLDMEAAMAAGAQLVHDDIPQNRCFTWQESHGDYATTRDRAEVVLKRRFLNQRLIPSAIEPRSAVAQPTPATNEYTLWSSTQVPHFVQIFLAITCGIPQQNIRVIAPDVGGGFGSKLDVYAEEAICLSLAKKLGVPVKWTETRSENCQVTIHGRDLIQDAEITAMRDGTVLGLKVDLIANMGAYLQLLTPCIPLLGRYMYPGIYKFEAHDLSCTGVFTNKTPTDAYRGAGRPEATFVIERIMDELANELGMDPLELRRKNWITKDEFPYTTISGLEYDSGDYEKATTRATELLGYDELRREQQGRRDRNDPVQIGLGVSTYTEMCGLAPSRWLGREGYIAGGWEAATVRVLPLGKVEVVTGTSPHGQSHETTFAQIAADALGIPFDDIVVVHGDTRTAPLGLDTYGSRSLAVGGMAILKACEKIVEKAQSLAAHQLECDPRDVAFSAGTFSVLGSAEQGKSIQELAFASFVAHDLPSGADPILTADAVVDPETFSFPHGTHLAQVEVDTETGKVQLKQYVAVDDVGKVVNPLVVDGQVHGGVAQGIAQALFEEAVYDDDGNLLSSTFVDYLLPTTVDLPSFSTDRTETPSTTNPLGVKGVGEAGTIASTPAVVNAVVDALRPLGVNDVPMPCSPMNVWRAINAAKGESR
jgi:aerobic carbon-monoxide dehydrogenase large subunit